MYLNPAQTDVAYVPSDGYEATVGSVQLSNVLVVTSAKGASGQLQGLATNNSSDPVDMTITPQGGSPTKITIPALKSVRLDGKTNGDDTATVPAVEISATPVAPGHLMTVTFATPAGGADPVSIPVLLDQEPYGSASVTHADSRPVESSSAEAP